MKVATDSARLLLVALLIACSSPPAKKAAEPDPVPTSGTTLADVGLDTDALDKTADPCVDFYQYACGGWLASHEIPADRANYGRFTEIVESNEAELRDILATLESQPDRSGPAARVRDYYASCMNTGAVEAAGIAPLEPLLGAIKGVRDRGSLVDAIARLHNHGIGAAFDLYRDSDYKDSKLAIAFLDQGGLGLPDRDYYLSDKPEMAKLREAYEQHIARMLKLAGHGEKAAASGASAIVALETRLAKASKTRVERRDVDGLYNRKTRAELSKLSAGFDWNVYFTRRGNRGLANINVTAPAFFAQLGKELRTTKLVVWRDYLTWMTVRSMAPHLSKAFVDESFAMARLLSGQKEQRPRWKRCLSATNAGVGEDLGRLYVERRFSAESKKTAEAMIAAISSEFRTNLDSLEWMSPETRARAAQKRELMAFEMGYPTKWKDYDFIVGPDTHAANVLTARAWEAHRSFDLIDKPMDRSEWYMLPQQVNAYYSPNLNQMVFPAGILQPPFFSARATMTVNLGAMGMIVGHELTHGFDDQGAQFAGNGNRENWWQPADLEQFKARGQCVVKQYSAYEALPGMRVNGELTLGENIADIGGVKMAFRAHRTLGGGDAPRADGFTGDQQFFLAAGQAWCSNYREQALKERLLTDPHSPGKFRVNGPLADLPEFAEAFQCKAGTPMNPADRCEVW